MSPHKYDVFVSYNPADAEIIKLLADELSKGGVRVWLDEEKIKPGQDWNKRAKQGMSQSGAVAVCIGPKGGDLEVEEIIRVALSLREDDALYLVIPVLLPGTALVDIPPSLKGLVFVDLRDGFNNSETIGRLATAIIERDSRPLATPPEQSKRGTQKSYPAPSSIPGSPDTGFISRQGDDGVYLVEQLKEELAPHKSQLVALWGAGGVGKTTLAAETARALADAFAQRVVWISADLHAELTLPVLLDDIATQLGRPDLRPLAPRTKEQQVRALIATAPTLVVLDNFEAIPSDEQMRCLEWIAQRPLCPTLTVSRQRVSAARNLNLNSMTPGEAQEFLDRLITMTRNADAFSALDREQIIRTADYNPQVLQWLTAQIALSASPQSLLSELTKRGGEATQRVFDRYFNSPEFTNDERAVLLALPLFMPSAPRTALSAVAGFSTRKVDSERLTKSLERLAALNLVKATTNDQRLAVEGLTRELARARLARDDHADAFNRRFASYFLEYAREHTGMTPEDLDAVEFEKENLLNAMDLAFKLKDWESVMRLMNAMAFPGMLDIRGYWDEALRRGMQATKAARVAGNEMAAAYFTANTATIRASRGEYREARRAYKQALVSFQKLKSYTNVAATLHQLGTIAFEQGEFDEAEKFYTEALEIARRRADQQGIASTLHQLGRVMQERGNLEEAHRLYGESLEIVRKLGDQSGVATTLHQLAVLAQDQGNLERARGLYDESLAIEKNLGDRSGISVTLTQLGNLAYSQGDVAEARRLYYESLEIKKRLGDRGGLAVTLNNLGQLADVEGNKAEAVRLFREALGIFENLGSPFAERTREALKKAEGESS